MDETIPIPKTNETLDDISISNLYGILFDDDEGEEMELSHENDDFLGFNEEEIECSRSKSNAFDFFTNDWMADFNVNTLWTGRNYSNLQFSLNNQEYYAKDSNIIHEFKLYPKYIEHVPQSFTLLESVSEKRNDQLFDTKGFTYNLKSHLYKDGRQHWRCTKFQTAKCKANIIISKQQVVEFHGLHIHEPTENVESLIFIRDLKLEALKDPYNPAPQVVARLLGQKGIYEEKYKELVSMGMPSVRSLRERVYRIRQKYLPPKETELFFDVDYQYLTMDFLQKDLIVDNQRYLFLSTHEQINYLTDAWTWFVDGTFAVVKKTAFAQLIVLHVIVGTPFNCKSIPVMFIFMSRRQIPDYIAVFTGILQIIYELKATAPYVTTIMLDFEIAMWSALRNMINDGLFTENLKLSGCTFHFCSSN